MKDRAACNLQPAQLPRPGGGRPASQDVPLEDVQYLAGHANPRTTQIYDRRRHRVTRNIVESISI